jgi:hypothetical protein
MQSINSTDNIKKKYTQRCLPGCIGWSWHETRGDPTYPSGHEHTGLWFTTWHKALMPQASIQGSRHFWAKHALSRGQSWLMTHSGYVQAAAPLTTRHWPFTLHGDGLHGSTGGAGRQKVTWRS